MRCLRTSSVVLYDITTVVIKTRAKNTPVHRNYGIEKTGSIPWTHHTGTLIGTELEAVPLGEKCSFFSRVTDMVWGRSLIKKEKRMRSSARAGVLRIPLRLHRRSGDRLVNIPAYSTTDAEILTNRKSLKARPRRTPLIGDL